MRLPHRLVASAAVLLALAGCGSATPPDVTGEWELVQLSRSGAVVPEPVGGRATLTASDGALGGTSFCSTYRGSYRLDGDALSVSGLDRAGTGCSAELRKAQSGYLRALAAVEHAAIADGYLVLSGGDTELRFRPLPEVPESDLTGNRWTLETLLDGEIASSPTGLPAVLDLAPDGTLSATTGCRELSGSWSLDGDVVWFTGVEPTAARCDRDVEAQDEQVTAVLSGDAQVAVTDDSLTLTGADGQGLVYRDAG